MKAILSLLFLFTSLLGSAQTNKEIKKEIKAYQSEENKEFGNSETTILDSLDFISFKKLKFYKIDLKYHVEAKLTHTPDATPFLMKTSTDRLPEYVKYAIAEFVIDEKDYKLNIYNFSLAVSFKF